MAASSNGSRRFFDLLQLSVAPLYYSAAGGHLCPRSLAACSSNSRRVGSNSDSHNNNCYNTSSSNRSSSTGNSSSKKGISLSRSTGKGSTISTDNSSSRTDRIINSSIKCSMSTNNITVSCGFTDISKPSLSAASCSSGSLSSRNRLIRGGGSLSKSNLSVDSSSSWLWWRRASNLGSRHTYTTRIFCSGSISSSVVIAKRWKRYIPFRSSRIPKTRRPPPPAPPLFSASSPTTAAMLQPSLELAVSAEEDDAEEVAAAAEAALQLSPWQAVRVLQAFLPPCPQSLSPAAAAAARSLFPAAARIIPAAAARGGAAEGGPAAAVEQGGKSGQSTQYATFDYFGQLQQQHSVTEAAKAEDEAAAKARGTAAEEEATLARESSSTGPSGVDTVRLSLNVAADLKRESVRGVCTLTHGVGSNVRLAVFCPDEEAPAMLALGADYAGVETLLPRIAKGWVGFDKALAVASVMPQLLKVARVLGPRKLMPSPKSGTVVTNLKEAVRAVKSGEAVEFRAEGENAEIKVVIGRTSFDASQLLENIKCVVKDVNLFSRKNISVSVSS